MPTTKSEALGAATMRDADARRRRRDHHQQRTEDINGDTTTLTVAEQRRKANGGSPPRTNDQFRNSGARESGGAPGTQSSAEDLRVRGCRITGRNSAGRQVGTSDEQPLAKASPSHRLKGLKLGNFEGWTLRG